MLAIFKTGGKQYAVKAGQILKVEKLTGNKGDKIAFNNILALSSENEKIIGQPTVEGAKIEAKIVDQIRDKKIIVFKKRRRQNYRSTKGHRQYLTVLKIETISIGNKKSTSLKKEKKEDKSIVKPSKKIPAKKKLAKKTEEKKTSPKKKVAKKTSLKKDK
tara:strand:- start:41 stop:520 length:480 start_codon:yes stop_codon:yes gene_type:complete